MSLINITFFVFKGFISRNYLRDFTMILNSLYKSVRCDFYNLLCKGSACFDRPEYWMNAICLARLFCEKLARANIDIISVRGLNDKQTTPDSSVYLGVDEG